MLKAAGLSGDQTLRADCIKSRDVHTLSLKSLETYADALGYRASRR
jgi:hypothetical protein